MMIDVSLALLGRINAQMQLLMLAFPAKMLVSMAVLAAIVALMPQLYGPAAAATLQSLRSVLTASN